MNALSLVQHESQFPFRFQYFLTALPLPYWRDSHDIIEPLQSEPVVPRQEHQQHLIVFESFVKQPNGVKLTSPSSDCASSRYFAASLECHAPTNTWSTLYA